MVQAHYKSFIRSDFKWRSSPIPVSPLRVVADYADKGASNIGFLDQRSQSQHCHRELLVHLFLPHPSCSEEAWPGCAFWHKLDFPNTSGRSLGFPFPHFKPTSLKTFRQISLLWSWNTWYMLLLV